MIDIISEEDIGDHCNIKDDESDEEDRPQKVAVSSIIMESYRGLVDECTRYLHIATLLINLPISTKMDTLFPDLSSLYESLSSEYHYRLPFWKLISEPWTLLEPLMIVDSEIGPKLAPLCPFLQIERDEFYVKRAIHLYTRCSLQQSTTVLVDSTPLVPSSSSSSTTIPLQLSPQMESLLKDIHDIASCTKKPLTRVKIWRLVYEMEKDRNSHIALKALQTALEVFHQIRLIPTITESEQQQQQYHDMKYEIILEIVKHKSKDILHGMQSYKMAMIRSYESTITPTTTNTTPPPTATGTSATPTATSATTCNTHNLWKHILCYESLVMKLTPYLGDINSLLKIFFENLLHEVWVMQCHAIRRTSVILTPYDLLNQKLLPIIIEYIKYAGNVALQLYEIHLALDTNHETKKEEIVSSNATTSATSVLTSSTLQSVRHSMIGKLLADVDIPESENHSRVMKSAAQGTNTQISGLVNGLWGTISSSDSIASPSSAELRRREDVYRAFSIATLLASCTPSCPRYFIL